MFASNQVCVKCFSAVPPVHKTFSTTEWLSVCIIYLYSLLLFSNCLLSLPCGGVAAGDSSPQSQLEIIAALLGRLISDSKSNATNVKGSKESVRSCTVQLMEAVTQPYCHNQHDYYFSRFLDFESSRMLKSQNAHHEAGPWICGWITSGCFQNDRLWLGLSLIYWLTVHNRLALIIQQTLSCRASHGHRTLLCKSASDAVCRLMGGTTS